MANNVKMIGTWRMSERAFSNIDKDCKDIRKMIIDAIKYNEDDKTVHTVGRYSYPNDEGFLELDAAFMDGRGNVGAVLACREIVNPIEVAFDLMKYRENNILTSFGADRYAKKHGFKTSDSLEFVQNEFAVLSHDTFAVIGLDDKNIYTGISSSGRKNKHLGRIGDSPLIGSGYYADIDVGAVCATGDGEAILRACLSKEIVMHMSYGLTVKEALLKACIKQKNNLDYDADFCAIAMDINGNYYAYTSINPFPFAIYDNGVIKLLVAYADGGILEADDNFLNSYRGD